MQCINCNSDRLNISTIDKLDGNESILIKCLNCGGNWFEKLQVVLTKEDIEKWNK
jgi:hypothetical protein